MAGAWQVRSGCVAARGQDFALFLNSIFCFKADSAHWERIMLLLDSRRFKDGRWQMSDGRWQR